MKPVIAWLCVWAIAMLAIYGMRPKRNRHTGLPTPSEKCRRSPDWQNYELQTSRKYIP